MFSIISVHLVIRGHYLLRFQSDGIDVVNRALTFFFNLITSNHQLMKIRGDNYPDTGGLWLGYFKGASG
ncbi:hypothetical protein METHB2_690001 [Candidatus Methylobacter favarea]|uniref:Uncharacterized protein n=1 Tax=Candidatus Methylobacter favarea TaxID=2707345 RepID=A0A8S0WRZ7_9GAMM|nr:hypothetical protein METHB2_690001 [Candidatus Methylobacter favarea]